MHIIQSMYDADVISFREAKIIDTVIARETLMIGLPERDIVRAQILKKIIEVILYEE